MQQYSKIDIVDEKYQRALIYGIICLITGEMYVGSTVHTLKERIAEHIRQRNCRAMQILNRGNYKAYVIQHYPCNTLREVLTLEGGWQRAYKASFGDFLVNRRIEGVFANDSPEAMQVYKKQYREEHKEERQVYDKQYREEHKEENKARDRKYYAEHKEERQAYDKQYREEHKEERQVYDKQYREEHKEEKRASDKKYAKRPWTCEWCNKTITNGGRATHKKKYCKSKPTHTDLP
jgi:flagellar biosynthesis GTPase FlhF